MAVFKEADQIKKDFFEENEEFSEIKAKNEITFDDFYEIDETQDEIWLLQCSKNLDVNLLMDHKLRLPGKTSLEQNVEAIAVEYVSKQKHVFGFCNKKKRYALRHLPIHGSIFLRKSFKGIEKVTEDKINAHDINVRRPILPNVKIRHPLLGAVYKDKIQIEKTIAEKLKSADDFLSEQTRRRMQNITKSKNLGNSRLLVNGKSDINIRKRKGTAFEVIPAEQVTTNRKKLKSSKEGKIVGNVTADLEWLKNI